VEVPYKSIVALTLLAALSLAIWLYILACRGGFWRVASELLERGEKTLPARRVVAVIPARNEARYIGQAVTSLLTQGSDRLVELVVVDDGSEDQTADYAVQAAERLKQRHRLTILTAKPLPTSWTGKLWALSQGVDQALLSRPDYILLTDADVQHGAQSISQLVGIAESRDLDLASFMVKLECRTFAEKGLIPAFVFFFLQLYPPAWIASSRFKTAGAAGGCILIRPEALERIGGFSTIRSAVIDDCALARAVKRNGGQLWLGLTSETRSMRSYTSFIEIGKMISRTAFSQLRHSNILLLCAVIGLLLTYVGPVIFLIVGNSRTRLLALTTLLLMAISYCPIVRFYGLPVPYSLTLPGAAVFYCVATIQSAMQYWRGQGGEWKGRAQDLRSKNHDGAR
jgi:hopene-associated glycosyltransferase HpnB